MSYSILCLHTRFNRKEMERVMGDNTVYFTMLRDPVDVFESQYGYYKLEKQFGISLGNFEEKINNMQDIFRRGICHSPKDR